MSKQVVAEVTNDEPKSEEKSTNPAKVLLARLISAILGHEAFHAPRKEIIKPGDIERLRIQNARLEKMIDDQNWLFEESIYELFDENKNPLGFFPMAGRRQACGCLFPKWQIVYRQRQGIWFQKRICRKCYRYEVRMWERRDWDRIGL